MKLQAQSSKALHAALNKSANITSTISTTSIVNTIRTTGIRSTRSEVAVSKKWLKNIRNNS